MMRATRVEALLLGGLMLWVPGAYSSEEVRVDPVPEVKAGVETQKGGPPELYRQSKEHLEEYQRLMEYDPKVTRTSKSISLPLANLDFPFEIEVHRDYITTLTFLDAKGRPFPTRVSRVGDKETFFVCAGTKSDCTVGEEDMDIAHILTIETTKTAGRSNLKVFFKGLHQAVQIPLVSKKRSYHDEITIMLPIDNPDATVPHFSEIPSSSGRIESDDYYARALIDGVSVALLPDAVPITVEVQNAVGKSLANDTFAAIQAGEYTYLKTRLRQPNPGATAITPGVQGYVVYRFKGEPRAITAIDDKGAAYIILLKHPSNRLGYRELLVK